MLGVQQAAIRLDLNVPMEADMMYGEAVKTLESSPWHEEFKKEVASNCSVDSSRSAANDDAARLGYLVKEMDCLGVRDGRLVEGVLGIRCIGLGLKEERFSRDQLHMSKK